MSKSYKLLSDSSDDKFWELEELVALMFLNEFCLAVNGTIADGLLVT